MLFSESPRRGALGLDLGGGSAKIGLVADNGDLLAGVIAAGLAALRLTENG